MVLTSDLKSETLAALSALMLAQSQQVFIDKAIRDRMKVSIISKLCAQGEELFSDAAAKLSKDGVKHIWDRSWTNNVAAKVIGYEGLSHYYASEVAGSQKVYGEQLARLQHFIKAGKKAAEKLGGNSSFLSVQLGEAEIKYRDGKRDNDFIYHEVIPSMEDLGGIDKVGSARLAKLGPLPDSFSAHFVDM